MTFDAVQLHGTTVAWIEGRPDGDALVSWSAAEGTHDVLPQGIFVASRVHEYGGGASLLTEDGIWFSRADDQRIWRTTLNGIVPVTEKGGDWRYADMRVSADGRLVCVRERHEGDQVVNELVAMPAWSCIEPNIIASGWDFYSFPRPSRDGRQLAWTTWRHPFMPWDATWLWIADIRPDGRLGDPRLIAGGEGESVFQPEWSREGTLHFVSDRSGWWNLYAYTGTSVEPVVLVQTEMGVAQWELGYATYAFLNRDRIALILQDGPLQTLAIWDPARRQLQRITLPYTSIKPYLATDGERLAVIASSPDRSPAVALIDPEREEALELAGGASSLGRHRISTPEQVTFRTRDQSFAHGVFYPPHRPQAQRGHEGPPPLIVRPHPGPTASAALRLDLWTQFFTSRGFAVLDVDYRGSSGYGRAYRCALRGRWGLLDVTDCADAVSHLSRAGRIDPTRVAISGASAGGYTALRALVTTDLFVGGVVRSAVVDPASWRFTASKFQVHYGHMLALSSPEAPVDFAGRSLLEHPSAITAPVLLIHGEDDPIAPLGPVRDLARRLGDGATLIVLSGEGHTVRQPANIARALDAELSHYRRVLAA